MGWNNSLPALMKEIKASSQKNKFFVARRRGWGNLFRLKNQVKSFGIVIKSKLVDLIWINHLCIGLPNLP